MSVRQQNPNFQCGSNEESYTHFITSEKKIITLFYPFQIFG